MGTKRILINLLPKSVKKNIFKKIELEHGTDALVDMIHEDYFEHNDNTRLTQEIWRKLFKK